MKIINSIAIIAIAGFMFTGCKKNTTEVSKEITKTEAPKVKKPIAPENLQSANFTIQGMTCAMGCAKTIEKELSDLEGVEKATVDFDTKLATISFDKSVQNQESLTKIVQATGDGKTYSVVDFKTSIN